MTASHWRFVALLLLLAGCNANTRQHWRDAAPSAITGAGCKFEEIAGDPKIELDLAGLALKVKPGAACYLKFRF